MMANPALQVIRENLADLVLQASQVHEVNQV